jgi:hypothetical protein
VSISPTFYEQLLRQKSTNVSTKKAGHELSHEKAAHKMLVKLTTVCSVTEEFFATRKERQKNVNKLKADNK